MAIVLSNQENIDLLLFLVKLAIALGAIAIALFLLFWLRLKKLEKSLYLRRKQVKPRLAERTLQRKGVVSQVLSKPTVSNLTTNRQRSPETQVYRPSLHTQNPHSKSSQKSANKPANKPANKLVKHSKHSRWSWFLAIAIASITGMAIALIQLGNILISPEFTPLVWLLIGVMLVVSATFVKIG